MIKKSKNLDRTDPSMSTSETKSVFVYPEFCLTEKVSCDIPRSISNAALYQYGNVSSAEDFASELILHFGTFSVFL